MFRCLIVAALATVSMLTFAQEKPDKSVRQIPAEKTYIEIELLMPTMGVDILSPQRWGKAFEKLGHSVRVRSQLPGDKPQVSEQVRGTLRFVEVVGLLDRDGKVVFPEAAYSLNDTDKLGKWLDDLKVYGAQGAPTGQPLWGLTMEQFNQVFAGLAQPVEKFVASGELERDVVALPIDSMLPVKFDETARALLKQTTDNPPSKLDVTGLTAGTGLAALLSQHGLGFHPLRTPAGTIELTIRPRSQEPEQWPIGWDADKSKNPGQTAPQLFAIESGLGLTPQPLEAAVKQVSQAVGLPMVIDVARCREEKIDVAKITVQAKPKRTGWGIVLRSVLLPHQLDYTLRHDEQGRPFAYIHPFDRTPAVEK